MKTDVVEEMHKAEAEESLRGTQYDRDSEFNFCPVCCEEMNETTNEDGDYELVCPHCGYRESY